MVIPESLTEQRKPPLFKSDDDLVEYALDLLGMVEEMNIDRETVREAINVHNQQVTPKVVNK